jgi:hypothetical protein
MLDLTDALHIGTGVFPMQTAILQMPSEQLLQHMRTDIWLADQGFVSPIGRGGRWDGRPGAMKRSSARWQPARKESQGGKHNGRNGAAFIPCHRHGAVAGVFCYDARPIALSHASAFPGAKGTSSMPLRSRARIGPDGPKVGEVGTIQYVVNDSRNRLSGYIVEHVRPNGVFGWSADFMVAEVEPVN